MTDARIVNTTPKRWRRWWFLGAAAGAVPLLYFLSAGPVLRLMQEQKLDQEWVIRWYAAPTCPLQVMVNMVPGGEALLHRYVALWGVS